MTEHAESSFSSRVEAAFLQAAADVIERAKQTATPVIVWENNHIREIPADQLEAALQRLLKRPAP